jgi:hypothetical protein
VSQLCNMTLENNNFVLEIIYSLINNGQINCRIDLINNVIVTNEVSQESIVMQKVIDNSNKTYSNCVNGLLSNIVKVKLNVDFMTKRNNFTEYKLENDKYNIGDLLAEMGGMGRMGGYGNMSGVGRFGNMGGMRRNEDNYDD